MKEFWKVINQFINEYWFALILTVSWTLFRLYNFSIIKADYRIFIVESTGNIIEHAIASFVTALAFTTFFTNNYFRIKATLSTDRSLQETVFQLTGGDSYCYLMFAINQEDVGAIRVVSHGDYPMNDVAFRIIIWPNPKSHSDGDIDMNAQEKHFMVHTLLPGIIHGYNDTIQLNKEVGASFECFIYSRSTPIKQFYRLVYHEGGWRSAIRLVRNGKIIFEQIHPMFPETDKERIFCKQLFRFEME